MTQEERRVFLLRYLLGERAEYAGIAVPSAAGEQRRMLRSLMNVRPAEPIGADFLAVQDEYLRGEVQRRGVTDAAELAADAEGLCLWQGDITTLRCGAIVNAANSGMTGCYIPCHGCIDNAIHTYAGVQLRLECARIMSAQGHAEPTGRAKITPAYNLRSTAWRAWLSAASPRANFVSPMSGRQRRRSGRRANTRRAQKAI